MAAEPTVKHLSTPSLSGGGGSYASHTSSKRFRHYLGRRHLPKSPSDHPGVDRTGTLMIGVRGWI